MLLHHVQVAMPGGGEDRAAMISAAGFEVFWTERETLEGFLRFHCRDGFGNRVELLTHLT